MILLIDKDPISADSIGYYLESAGYDILTSFDPRGAADAIAAADPELVILEVILSGMNGLALCQALKNDERIADVPILILSVLSAKQRALEAGAEGFLLKPVGREELLTSVTRILSGDSALSATSNQAETKVAKHA